MEGPEGSTLRDLVKARYECYKAVGQGSSGAFYMCLYLKGFFADSDGNIELPADFSIKFHSS
mgnify:FL=1